MTSRAQTLPNHLNDNFTRYLYYSLGLHLLFFLLTIFLIPRSAPLSFGLTEIALYRESPGPAKGAEVTSPISYPQPKTVQPKEKNRPAEKPLPNRSQIAKQPVKPIKPAKPEVTPVEQPEKDLAIKEKTVPPQAAAQPPEQTASSSETAVPQPPSGIKGASGTGTALEKGGMEGPAAKRRILFLEYPDYPAWARARGIEMETTVRFWVEPGGKVKNVETIRRSGWLDVDQEVENKVYKWLFEPIPAGLKQEDQWGQVAIKFRLTD